MASKISKSFTNKVTLGLINLATDSFKASLHTNSFTPNESTMSSYADLTNELTGTGYTAGGQAFTPNGTADDATNKQTDALCLDLTWTAATFTNVRFVCIYDTTVGNALICCIDFGANQSCSGQDFIVAFNSNTWLKVGYG